MLQKFANFMMGRYGGDKFNFFLIILSVIVTLVGSIVRFYPIQLISYLFLGYALFRTFSRNIPARQKENNAFLKVYSPMEKWFKFKKTVFANRKTYTYFKCPNCKQHLRAPKGRGKIRVVCQKCHKEFEKKV